MAQAIGGQAVLEGVMMRGPRNWAVAVRKPDGEIAHVGRPIDPLATRHWSLRLPVIRGVVALGESLAIGFRALSVSANYAAQDAAEGDPEPEEIGRWTLFFSFAVAIGFALMLFKVGPALLADTLPIHDGFLFVLVSDGEIAAGMRFLYSRAKLACEPAGAAATAALLAGKVTVEPGSTVVAVVSGGNADPKVASAILGEADES